MTILRAQWSPNADAYPHFTVSGIYLVENLINQAPQIGNMKHSLDIFSGKGELVARLSDPSR